MNIIIRKFEESTQESNKILNQAECDFRDLGKKVQSMEIAYEETMDKFNTTVESLEEKGKVFMEIESDISALTRRIMLIEEEAKKAETNLSNIVTKLALSSKEADEVLKKIKVVESKCMSN